ncbi:hypothetical protein [Cupriavidus sp. SK-4]|uniref:hypothetical protein n=1 Tax=Cupriavidus sp. SK-4 TaxID=574750 RepID=UPI00190FB4F3|nr:hypothetical protein [Cupriavidus sp. SK-4]
MQELSVGFNLSGKQEWNLMYRRALRKAFANALLFGEAVRHGISESSQGWLDLAGPEVFSDWEGIWRLAATNLWLTVSARCGRCGRRIKRNACTRPGDTRPNLSSAVGSEDKHQQQPLSVPLMFGLC